MHGYFDILIFIQLDRILMYTFVSLFLHSNRKKNVIYVIYQPLNLQNKTISIIEVDISKQNDNLGGVMLA